MDTISICGLTVKKPQNYDDYMILKRKLEDLRDLTRSLNIRKNDSHIPILAYAKTDKKDKFLTIYVYNDEVHMGVYEKDKGKITQKIEHNNPRFINETLIVIENRIENTVIGKLPENRFPDLLKAWRSRLREIELEKEKQVEEPEIKKQVAEPNPLVFAPLDERIPLIKETTAKKNAERKEHHISYDECER